MSSRNLTEVYNIMRNNSSKHKNIFSSNRQTVDEDSDFLLKHSINDDAVSLVGIGDDYDAQPPWIYKLEEAQYTMSKIKPKLDELGSLYARHLLRPTFDESPIDDCEIKKTSQEISKFITVVHRHIQCIRSSLNIGTKREQLLTASVVMCLMIALQDLTMKFRNSQNTYHKQLNVREEHSQKFFDAFKKSDGKYDRDAFHNFEHSKTNLVNDNDDQNLDEYFQRSSNYPHTQKQMLLFEKDNIHLIMHRDDEVTKIVSTIYDLNDIFKDLNQLVQHQGTILDRIDYSIEQTQTRVSQGLQQLHKAEIYHRKNCKMWFIILLASITFFMLLILITSKL